MSNTTINNNNNNNNNNINNNSSNGVGGLKSWPAIFSYPKEPPIYEHWPNIISVIYENVDSLNKYRDPVTFFDKKVQCTYFISKIEEYMYFVAIYDKKKDNDVSIKEFSLNICNYLRNFKLYEQLKSHCFRID